MKHNTKTQGLQKKRLPDGKNVRTQEGQISAARTKQHEGEGDTGKNSVRASRTDT